MKVNRRLQSIKITQLYMNIHEIKITQLYTYTRLAKVSTDLCSAIDRTTKRMNDKASTVTLARAPRVN